MITDILYFLVFRLIVWLKINWEKLLQSVLDWKPLVISAIFSKTEMLSIEIFKVKNGNKRKNIKQLNVKKDEQL